VKSSTFCLWKKSNGKSASGCGRALLQNGAVAHSCIIRDCSRRKVDSLLVDFEGAVLDRGVQYLKPIDPDLLDRVSVTMAEPPLFERVLHRGGDPGASSARGWSCPTGGYLILQAHLGPSPRSYVHIGRYPQEDPESNHPDDQFRGGAAMWARSCGCATSGAIIVWISFIDMEYARQSEQCCRSCSALWDATVATKRSPLAESGADRRDPARFARRCGNR